MPKRKLSQGYIVETRLSIKMISLLRDMSQFEQDMRRKMSIAVTYKRWKDLEWMLYLVIQKWQSLEGMLPTYKINLIKTLDVFMSAIQSIVESDDPIVTQKTLEIFIKYKIHHLRTRAEDDTLLIIFAKLGRRSYKAYEGLQRLLQEKTIDINYQNIDRHTALLYVLLNNTYKYRAKSEETLSLLLDYGASIAPIDRKLIELYNSRALIFQSAFFEMIIRRMFLANESLDPNEHVGFKRLLVKERFIDTALFYLNLNRKIYTEQRALFVYFIRSHDVEVVRLLIARTPKIEAYIGCELLSSSTPALVQAGLNSCLKGVISLISKKGILEAKLLESLIQANDVFSVQIVEKQLLGKDNEELKKSLYNFFDDVLKRWDYKIRNAIKLKFYKTICLLMDFCFEYDFCFFEKNFISIQRCFIHAVAYSNIEIISYFKQKKVSLCVNISESKSHPQLKSLHLFDESILFYALTGLRKPINGSQNVPQLINELIDMGANFEKDQLCGTDNLKKRCADFDFYRKFRNETKKAILNSFVTTHMSHPPLVEIITNYALLEEPALELHKPVFCKK